MWTTHAVQGKIFWDLKLKENKQNCGMKQMTLARL